VGQAALPVRSAGGWRDRQGCLSYVRTIKGIQSTRLNALLFFGGPMRHLIAFAFLSGFCSAEPSTAQDAKKEVNKELKAFQGKWTLVGGQNLQGQPFNDDDFKNMTLTVEGNKFAIKNKDAVTIEGTFTVGSSKKFKTIDLEVTSPNVGKVLGIYEQTGDTRKSCFAIDSKDRPDGYRMEKGYLIVEWKKAK
jgi:uncharacterized protein (TIGR03067 family)